MATKETINSENVDEQHQPVVDRDKVKQEREARRAAKLASKQKLQDKSRNLSVPTDDEKKSDGNKETSPKQTSKQVTSTKITSPKVDSNVSEKKSHRKEQIPGKCDSKKEKTTTRTERITKEIEKLNISCDSKQSSSGSLEKPEKKQLTKAERRAIQEAQRAAKAAKTTEKTTPPAATKRECSEPKVGASVKSKSDTNTPSKSHKSSSGRAVIKRSPQQQHRVKLFNHLYTDISPVTPVNSNENHPAIVRLGVQYSGGVVKGCNARGLAFMNTIRSVIAEYETPSQKEFSRGLEDVIKNCGKYLQQCRPLAVSVTNAMKFIQFQLRQLPKSESDAHVRKR